MAPSTRRARPRDIGTGSDAGGLSRGSETSCFSNPHPAEQQVWHFAGEAFLGRTIRQPTGAILVIGPDGFVIGTYPDMAAAQAALRPEMGR